MPRPLRVFLCHASQDKPAVRELYNALKTESWIDPWLDKAKILPGQDWEMVIEKAVDNSDVVIVCLSNQAVNKEGFVQREIRYAYDLALEKPDDTIFLIPLRLDDCSVPRKLRTLHWVDYFGFDKKNSYSNLLYALKFRHDQKMKTELEELVRSQAKEQAQRESLEKALREKWEKEQREKVEKERVDLITRANLEREEAQKALLEFREKEKQKKAKHETAKKTVYERLEFEAAERTRLEKVQREKEKREAKDISAYQRKPAPKIYLRLLGVGGIILLTLLAVIFGRNYLAKNIPSVEETPNMISSPTLTVTLLTETPTATYTDVLPTSTLTITAAVIPGLGIGSTMIAEIDGMVLVYVPEGEFTMGSDLNSNEQPIHQVDLDAFWIDQTEVTNKQYAACVNAHVCESPSTTKSYTRNGGYYGLSEFDNYPVVYVNWHKAKAYCKWAGRRLPSEAEWEKAARGTDARTYPWGDRSPNAKLLNYINNIGDTTEVGKYPDGASIYGAFDMAGNVWEWVSDWYDDTYYKSSPSSNPLGPDSGQFRVLRGGSYYYYALNVRSAVRYYFTPSYSHSGIGFRCARSP